MSIAQSIIDYTPNKESIKITNLDALPAGTGCPYLLVIESLYADTYIAERWMRKLPRSIPTNKRIIRF